MIILYLILIKIFNWYFFINHINIFFFPWNHLTHKKKYCKINIFKSYYKLKFSNKVFCLEIKLKVKITNKNK
jgi:hypothetical protein